MKSHLLVTDNRVQKLVNSAFEKYDYIFISYIDPYECISCYMNSLVRIHNHPVLKDNKVGYVIMVSPDSSEAQIEMVREYCGDEIINIIDTNNAIYDANPALAVSACRTFMISREYNVLWVGNPLISKETVRLFEEGINCLKRN